MSEKKREAAKEIVAVVLCGLAAIGPLWVIAAFGPLHPILAFVLIVVGLFGVIAGVGYASGERL